MRKFGLELHPDKTRLIEFGRYAAGRRKKRGEGKPETCNFLPRKARELHRKLREQDDTVPLGTLADVGIGYVTGANDFFHLDPHAVAEWGIPSRFLRACVRRGRALAGLRFTRQDWQAALAQGQAGYLLELPAEADLPHSILRYLAYGKKLGVHRTFKCRTRTLWYRVPHVYHPDAFLTYMSRDMPRLVANDAGVVAPNTLHILRLRPGTQLRRDGITALWQTSLARLSAEVEGHALGGGMLKLEPGEAEQVILPLLSNRNQLDALAAELDETARRDRDTACAQIADRQLLQRGLGLSAAERGSRPSDVAGRGELYEVKKAEDESRIHHVKIGTFSEGLLHAVGQVSERIPGALGRDPYYGPETRVHHGHIQALRFDPAEDPQFRCVRPLGDTGKLVFKIRPRLSLVRRLWVDPPQRKTALEYEPVAQVAVNRPYMGLRLRARGAAKRLDRRVKSRHPIYSS